MRTKAEPLFPRSSLSSGAGKRVLTSLISISILSAGEAIAGPNPNWPGDIILAQATEALSLPPLEQVTSVSQLSDIEPTDWAFQALQSLVERYGCLAGYPDGSYRGDRALTRYEFAAGLNACLDRIGEIIAGATLEGVTRTDLATLQRLQEEFAAELAPLRRRVRVIEARIAELESNQFSTTTKLNVQVDVAPIVVFSDKKPVPYPQTPTEDLVFNLILLERARLTFDSSFTGRDLFRIKLRAGNVTQTNRSVTGTNMTSHKFSTNTANEEFLDALFYRFPIGDRTQAYFVASGVGSELIVSDLSPILTNSEFGARNLPYRVSGGGGFGLVHKFNEYLTGSMVYMVLPNFISEGLFDGQYGALIQLIYTPNQDLELGLAYTRYYSPEPNVTGGIGGEYAEAPFGRDTPTSANVFGLVGRYNFGDDLTLGGWIGYTTANAESSPSKSGLDGASGSDAEILNWAVIFNLHDLGKEGSQLGFVLGMPPKVISNDVEERLDGDTAYHLEILYRYPLSSNITIAPGVYAIFNPEHNSKNGPIWVTTVRTTFSF